MLLPFNLVIVFVEVIVSLLSSLCLYLLISSHKNQHKPSCHVDDLIEGLQDGTKLLALLEVLSGERLVCCHS